MARRKTPAARVGEVLASLAEGRAVAAAVRVVGHAEGTITTWLTRAGMHSERLHAQKMRKLQIDPVHLDELSRDPEDRRMRDPGRTTLRGKGHEVWRWLARDARTKLIAAAELGPRTQATAHALIHGLVQVLALGGTPLFTRDGLNRYFDSLTAHWGTWVESVSSKKREWQVATTWVYGQLIKSYRRRKLARVERVMRWDALDALKAKLPEAGGSGVLPTAFVERVNLTVRRGLAMLARRSWSTPQTIAPLKEGLAWWRAYYHFVKPHAVLRVELTTPRERSGMRISSRDGGGIVELPGSRGMAHAQGRKGGIEIYPPG
jgi:IS1 family transposase